MKHVHSIDYEIGFADSKVLSFFSENDDFIVILECWNSIVLRMIFKNYISINIMNSFNISDIVISYDSDILEKSLNFMYEVRPKEHKFTTYQFLNSDDLEVISIVCDGFLIEKLNGSLTD